MDAVRTVEANLKDFQQVLGHQFRQPQLLERALTHRSALGDRSQPPIVGDNEQLEYLGDAVLSLLVSEHLIGTFPEWSEGQLSKGRARLVNAGSLCAAARGVGLGPYLRLSRGEEKTGGREKPALLANAYEAVVAAVYLDAGLPAARGFVGRTLLEKSLPAEGDLIELSDPKSSLQELLQARGLPVARYAVVRQSGPDHRKMFWVEVSIAGLASATGSGWNKKEAEQSAAQQALERLRGGTDRDE